MGFPDSLAQANMRAHVQNCRVVFFVSNPPILAPNIFICSFPRRCVGVVRRALYWLMNVYLPDDDNDDDEDRRKPSQPR